MCAKENGLNSMLSAKIWRNYLFGSHTLHSKGYTLCEYFCRIARLEGNAFTHTPGIIFVFTSWPNIFGLHDSHDSLHDSLHESHEATRTIWPWSHSFWPLPSPPPRGRSCRYDLVVAFYRDLDRELPIFFFSNLWPLTGVTGTTTFGCCTDHLWWSV